MKTKVLKKNKAPFYISILTLGLMLILSVATGNAQLGVQNDVQGYITEGASLFLFVFIALGFVDVLLYKVAGVSILKWIFTRFGA